MYQANTLLAKLSYCRFLKERKGKAFLKTISSQNFSLLERGLFFDFILNWCLFHCFDFLFLFNECQCEADRKKMDLVSFPTSVLSSFVENICSLLPRINLPTPPFLTVLFVCCSQLYLQLFFLWKSPYLDRPSIHADQIDRPHFSGFMMPV